MPNDLKNISRTLITYISRKFLALLLFYFRKKKYEKVLATRNIISYIQYIQKTNTLI